MLRYEKEKYHLLAINVRYFRQKNRMQSKDLAQKLCYSPSWVSKLEKGNHKEINREDVEKLAEVLGTTLDVLIGEDVKLYSKITELENKIKNRQIDKKTESDIAGLILHVTENNGPREQALAHWVMGSYEYVCANYDRAIESYDIAMDIANNFNDISLYHKLNLSKVKAFLAKGAYHDAENILRINRPQSTMCEFENLQLLGYLLSQQERWSEAETVLKKAITIATKNDHSKRKRAECLQYLGVVHLNNGAFEAAISVSHEAISLANDTGDVLCRLYCHRIIGDALRKQGSNGDARDEFVKAYQLSKDRWMLENLELTFKIALCSDDLSSQYYHIKSTLEKLEQVSNHPRSMAKIYDEATEVAIELKQLDDAKEFHRKTVQNYRAILR